MEFNPHLKEATVGSFKTSHAWYEELFPNHELVILDPDGWDRSNFQFSYFEELIDIETFHKRMHASTCIFYAVEQPTNSNK